MYTHLKRISETEKVFVATPVRGLQKKNPSHHPVQHLCKGNLDRHTPNHRNYLYIHIR